MPSWKIKGYKFFFKAVEILEKHEPVHIHVKTKKGVIEFWLEPPNTKIKDEISIKAEKGHVSKNEKSEIAKIVREQRDKFLDKWNAIKKRKEQIETESSSSSDNGGSRNEGLEEINTLSNLNLNSNLEEQNLNQVEIQESPHYQENEASIIFF